MKQQPPKITPELKSAVETFLLAKVHLEMTRPIVEGYQRKILADMQPHYRDEYTNGNGRKGNKHNPDAIITDPKDSWQMDEADFREYIDRCHHEHLAHGFRVPYEHCPLLIAKHELSKAQRLVLDAAQYITGIEALDFMHPTKERNGLENYYHAVDLTVSLVVSLCPDIKANTLIRQVLQ